MRVKAEDLRFRHDESSGWVFDGFSGVFEEGSTTALVGPSGSGKSTLLDLLGKRYSPSSGQIHYENWPPMSRLHASWVLQSNSVLGARTALDNVAIGALSSGLSYGRAKVRAFSFMEELGISDKAENKISQLSGGEVQRVTIARCFLADSPLMLADEPTGQLDAINTSQVISALNVFARKGKIVVIATHDPSVATKCDHLVTVGSKV